MLDTPRGRAAVLVAALGVVVVAAIVPFFSGLLGAVVLYVIFAAPYRWLAGRIAPGPTAAILLVAALVIIALPFSWIVALVVDQTPEVVRSIQHSALLARAGTFRIGPIDVGSELSRGGSTIVAWLSSPVRTFVGGAAAATLNVVVALFGFYYMMRSSARVWDAVRGYIPFSPATAEALRLRFVAVTEAMLLGSAVVAIVQGSIVGIGFLAVGLPNPTFWGLITALASILPVLGSSLVWLPGALVLVASERYAAAGVLVTFGLVASTVDNFIRPFVYRRVSDLHPMITLVGAFAGVRYLGLVGLLLGPLAIAYLFELLAVYRDEYGPRTTRQPERIPRSVSA